MNYYKKNKALDAIKNRKISIILQDPDNNVCFECSKSYPYFISLNNSIFLCKECVKHHLKLNKSISNIINNDLNNLSMKNIQYLSYGGNKNLKNFIYNNFPDLMKLSPFQFYNTYALDYYRKMIGYLVEGGVKPIKPEKNKAYEFVNKINEENNIEQYIDYDFVKKKRNNKLIRKIKSDSFIKFRNYPYPKIKPIIGTNTESRFTYFSNPKKSNNNINKLSQTITNLNNYVSSNTSLDGNNNYKTHIKLNSSSIENKRAFYPNFKTNYDIDDENTNNNLFNTKGTLYDLSNNSNEKNKNIKLREKILKRNELDKDLNIYNSNQNNNNNIYSKYMTQNYINTYKLTYKNDKNLYRNDNTYNISKNNNNNNTAIFNYDKGRDINNMELRSYLQNKYGENENYIFNLKLNSAKPALINGLNEEEYGEIKNKASINNINNNIIINRNLNVFYNHNDNKNTNFTEAKKIFKKKPIGNSFTLNEVRKSVNDKYYSRDKLDYLINQNKSENLIQNNSKKKIKERNINNKKVENNFIKVNKIKTISITNKELLNKSHLDNTQITVEKNLNENKNEINTNINNKISENQESMIIQRISRVIKFQKERKEKNKSSNETKDLSQNNNKFKFKIINVEKISKKKENKKEKEKDKEKIKLKDKNIVKEIKIKIYQRNDKSLKNNNLMESRKTNHSLMRELNNLPSGKKKKFLEIIKSNILSNKSVSNGAKKILKLSTEAKFANKK